MDGEYCCRIERAKNGFEIEMTDPAIVEQNRKRDMKGDYRMPYKSPRVSYVFKSVKEVLAFLEKNLETALPLDEYNSAFDEAVNAEDDD